MYFAAQKILGDEQRAEDAVHQSFLRLMEKSQQLGKNPNAWSKSFYIKVCKNISIDMLRKNKRSEYVPLDDGGTEQIPDKWRDTEKEVLANAGVEAIVKQILALPEIYKDIILMQYNHNLTVKQMADVLSISEEATKKRLQRARKRLMENLEKEGADV